MLALLELFGAANFVLIYLYAFKSLALKPGEAILRLMRRLEPFYLFFPTWRVTKQMPALLMHAVPLHTAALVWTVFMVGAIARHGVDLL